ncbi:hypothetical protein CDAR_248371 [Caerostris darwini]|uniref:Uncharacterized protein n=1 Tax=Caerostris darwini TaxID=1538125 RepID=A0AAV4UWK7_9ARAC|nr:hypothetical protein CDAR_248371 [Caerostris darwini]
MTLSLSSIFFRQITTPKTKLSAVFSRFREQNPSGICKNLRRRMQHITPHASRTDGIPCHAPPPFHIVCTVGATDPDGGRRRATSGLQRLFQPPFPGPRVPPGGF